MKTWLVKCEGCSKFMEFDYRTFERFRYGNPTSEKRPICLHCGKTFSYKDFDDAQVYLGFQPLPKYEYYTPRKGQLRVRRIKYSRKHGGRGISER